MPKSLVLKIPHFYSLHSRLGLIAPPHGETEINQGVEHAPPAILNQDFLTEFENFYQDSHFFSLPENLNTNEYYQVLVEESVQAASLIEKTLKHNEIPVVLGGDHSVTFASLLALSKQVALEQVVYIQVDSHADINTLHSSPTGNFHGMYLRAFTEQVGVLEVDSVVQAKLLPENIFYLGNLDLDSEEKQYLEKQQIRILGLAELESSNQVDQLLSEKIKTAQHVHLTIDIDAFDKSIAPATGIPAERGLFLPQVLPLLKLVKTVESLSIDLVEINPRKSGAEQTINLGQEILRELLL